jgi:outer membrane protein assembly factor BamB
MKPMNSSALPAAVLAAFTLLPCTLPAADHWPQLRGPGARGVADTPGLPEEWGQEKNVVWKVDVPGRGWSSPVVWGNRIFLTTAISAGDEEEAKKGLYFGGDRKAPSQHQHRFVVLAIDFDTGKVVWQKEVHKGAPPVPRHIKNSHASETQATDGKLVYSLFGDLGLHAHDFEGNLVWSKALPAHKTRYGWGAAASPALHEGKLYVVDDNEEASSLTAYEASTGKELWRVDRDEKSNWATPFVWQHAARTEIVTPGSGKVRSYGLDGKLLWELRGMSSITIATPFEAHGLLYLGSGFVMDKLRPLYAIRPGAAGDISLKDGETENRSIAWCDREAAPYNPSFLVDGDFLYVLFDNGTFNCREAKTGKPVYGKKRLGSAGAFTASPWAYGGKVFCLSEEGDTFVVEGGRDFKVLRTNPLGEMCMATPAIARKSLLIRTLGRLYRIEAR